MHYALNAIRDAGCRAGLAVNPATPLGIFAEVDVDVALCMSVNPGWGGQAFIPESLDRIGRLRAIIGDDPVLEVDGGVDERTAGPVRGRRRDASRRRQRGLRRAGPGRRLHGDRRRCRRRARRALLTRLQRPPAGPSCHRRVIPMAGRPAGLQGCDA